MDMSKKMERAEKLKNEGNDMFKKKNYEKAKEKYLNCLESLQQGLSFQGEGKKKITALELTSHLNLAQCYLMLEQNEEAINHCDKVLKIEPHNEKALYRRGQAYKNLALKDFHSVSRVNPKNNLAKRMIEKLEEPDSKKSKHDQDDKKGDHEVAQIAPFKTQGETLPGNSLPGIPDGTAANSSTGFDLETLFPDSDIQALVQDPNVKEAFHDILSNPASIAKYQNNEQVSKLFEKMSSGLKDSSLLAKDHTQSKGSEATQKPIDNTNTFASLPSTSSQAGNVEPQAKRNNNFAKIVSHETDEAKRKRIEKAKKEYDDILAEILEDEKKGEGVLYAGKKGFPAGGYPGPAGFPAPGGFPGADEFPGAKGFPGAGSGANSVDLANLLKDPEVVSSFKDEEVAQAFREISKDPANIGKYHTHERVQNVFKMLCTKLGTKPPPPPTGKTDTDLLT